MSIEEYNKIDLAAEQLESAIVMFKEGKYPLAPTFAFATTVSPYLISTFVNF